MTTGRTVKQNTLPNVLRQHNDRITTLEREVGRWIYVLPMSPATPPQDFNEDDPLSSTFVSGWSNVADKQAVSYRLHPATVVQIRGAIEGGDLPSIVFVLPEKYRPARVVPIIFPSQDSAAAFTGRIDTDGSVWVLDTIAGSGSGGISCATVNVCDWFEVDTSTGGTTNGYGTEFISTAGIALQDDSTGGVLLSEAGDGDIILVAQGDGDINLTVQGIGDINLATDTGYLLSTGEGFYLHATGSGGAYIESENGGGVGFVDDGGGGTFFDDFDGGGTFFDDDDAGGIYLQIGSSTSSAGGEFALSNYADGSGGGIFIANRTGGGTGDGNGDIELRNEGTGNIELNAQGGGDVTLSVAVGSFVYLLGIPTANPGGAGRVWNDSGTLKIT